MLPLGPIYALSLPLIRATIQCHLQVWVLGNGLSLELKIVRGLSVMSSLEA